MTPKEIRALYVETLARADYADWLERVRAAAARWGEECEHLPWDEQPEGGEWGREHWRRIHAPAVDALAAAGLLPKYMDRRSAYKPNGDPLGYFERQFLTEWRRMDDSCPACRVNWNDCRPPDYRCCPDCRHPLREVTE